MCPELGINRRVSQFASGSGARKYAAKRNVLNATHTGLPNFSALSRHALLEHNCDRKTEDDSIPI
jgi:hypothetical protein